MTAPASARNSHLSRRTNPRRRSAVFPAGDSSFPKWRSLISGMLRPPIMRGHTPPGRGLCGIYTVVCFAPMNKRIQ